MRKAMYGWIEKFWGKRCQEYQEDVEHVKLGNLIFCFNLILESESSERI